MTKTTRICAGCATETPLAAMKITPSGAGRNRTVCASCAALEERNAVIAHERDELQIENELLRREVKALKKERAGL